MRIYKRSERKTFEDERGLLDVLLEDGVLIKNALFMTSKTDAVRGSHVHRKDTHYCLLISGGCTYVYLEGENPVEVKMEPGDIVFSPSGETHKFVFTEDSEMLALATQPRSQDKYESDTERKEF